MDAKSIIERAKRGLGLTSDIELANLLGINKSTLSNWKSRNTIDYSILFSKCKHLDLNWLIHGGEDGDFPVTKSTGQAVTTDNYHTHQAENHKIIPLIPYDAFAGYGEFAFQDLPIENYYTINEFNTADFLIRVKGDSMYPKYNSGDLIACKKVKEVTFWQWHRIYAICTKNQGILIKRVEEFRENPAFITLVSENPKYRPFEIHEDEIIDVALVLGAIILE